MNNVILCFISSIQALEFIICLSFMYVAFLEVHQTIKFHVCNYLCPPIVYIYIFMQRPETPESIVGARNATYFCFSFVMYRIAV